MGWWVGIIRESGHVYGVYGRVGVTLYIGRVGMGIINKGGGLMCKLCTTVLVKLFTCTSVLE